ncbi:uncharacterized protein LOC113548381 isoform X2 [Rhopalosiphum maidis]|uniref:uncharacterized protein LOC113548381 isoform X2 n=1 Tax=Rhopalosiphum maidis TaxID=43146 RepID=UPI000EFEA2A3|nr:uncharacterized protein LOC113548381 isoform X2 [Rhopalosiphum maidis]
MIVLAVIAAAAFMNGDWLTVVAHTQNYLDGGQHQLYSRQRPQLSCTSFFDEFKVQLFWAMVVGYGIYFGFCGYLEWKYYVKGRGKEAQWKCQPNRHLPRHLVWDQIKWGCIGLMVTNAVSAAVATHVTCGGYSKVYIAFCQYPWWWWILQWPVIFFQQFRFMDWLFTRTITASYNIRESLSRRSGGSPGNRIACSTTTTISTVTSTMALIALCGIRFTGP